MLHVWFLAIPIACGQMWYILKHKKLIMYTLYDHAFTYITWITLMAYFRTLGQNDIVYYITESLLETITLDKGYCKGNLYAAFWYLLLLVIYVYHAIQVYLTMVQVKKVIPDVKKMQTVPPRMESGSRREPLSIKK